MSHPHDPTIIPPSGNYDPRVFDAKLSDLIESARTLPKGRESSLVVTHLETARLWLGEVEGLDGPIAGRLK